MSYWTELGPADPDEVAELWRDPEHAPSLEEAASASPPLELPGILPLGVEFGHTLEVLTEAVCTATGAALRFEACAGRLLGGDEIGDTTGAFVVEQPWVELMAGLSPEQRAAAARQWIVEWDPGLRDDPEAAAAARGLVDSICEVCARAGQLGRPLICAWFM